MADEQNRTARAQELKRLLRERIVLLDGAMGTMIQAHHLDEAAFRGERFRDWPRDLKGNNDLLNLTQPQIIRAIHRQYLEAGADIIEANTFNSTAISLADYGLEELAYELNVAGGRLARAEADAGSLSLDALTDLVAEHLFARHPDKAALLRDLLLRDRLASVKTTLLPASLKRRDARYHELKRALDRHFPREENTPRAIGLLYAGEEDQVVFCDYLQADPVTGLYDLQVMPAAQLLASPE